MTHSTQASVETLSTSDRAALIAEVSATSNAWIASFNAGNAEACAAGYEQDALMEAKPIGEYKGHDEIFTFWHSFIDSGAAELVYSNVKLTVIDATTVLLSADWRMNVGRGIITEERWVKGDDGKWRLRFDAFEVQERFE